MKLFEPQFRITNAVARDLTVIERARGFFAAATLSEDWIAQMSERAGAPAGSTSHNSYRGYRAYSRLIKNFTWRW